MATYRKRGRAWRVEVCRAGERESATFNTKAEAQAWAAERELALARGETRSKVSGEMLHRVFDRYLEEVAIRHKGLRWERIRLERIKGEIKDVPISAVSPDDLIDWREKRLTVVSGSSVRREMGLLMSVFEAAVTEWRLLPASPMAGIYRPPEKAPRSRIISDDERDLMVAELSRHAQGRVVALAFLFALESAMRAGEILSLGPERVTGAVAHLLTSKNEDAREVPLSPRALEILAEVGGRFVIGSEVLSQMFRQARIACGLSGFTFHDSRATAITRLSKKLDILELARMVGHRDLNSLMIYYRKTAAEIAARL